MMHKIFFFSLLITLSSQAFSGSFNLITAGEFDRDKAAVSAMKEIPIAPRRTPAPGAPQVIILAPSLLTPVRKTPVRIEISFQAEAGAHIVPESFRVTYGMLRLDITERLRKHGTLTAQGAVAEKAEMPAGDHRLYLKIADDQGRVTEQEMHITVDLD